MKNMLIPKCLNSSEMRKFGKVREPRPVLCAQKLLNKNQHTEDTCNMFTENMKKNQCAHTVDMFFSRPTPIGGP